MLNSATVLVVDIDKAQANLLANAVRDRLNYKTMIAVNGIEAVNAVLSASNAPDIMLLDIRVSQVDAISVINTVKYYRPDFPILIIIEYGGTERGMEAVRAGARLRTH